MVAWRLILILAVIGVVIYVVTYLLHRLFRRQRFVKYVPALVLLILAAYYFYLSTRPSMSFEDIGYIILAVMFSAGALSGTVSALILDFVAPKFFKKE